jgi:hypothetical protein
MSRRNSRSLKALVSNQQLDEVLSRVSLIDIADAWWRHTLRDRPNEEDISSDPDWWAVMLWVDRPIYQREDTVRAGLMALVERAPDEKHLDLLGAGPIEAFITRNDDRIRWIEKQAAVSPRFRKALANVWAWELPDELFLRLEKAAGVKLFWNDTAAHRKKPTEKK